MRQIGTQNYHQMSAWLKSKESSTPLRFLNGCSFWEMIAKNSEFNELFNKAMASDAKFVMDVLLKEHGHVFAGVERLVDVGGGTGSAALAISEKFPNISCTVLDLEQVVNTVEEEDKKLVEFVAGDMFDFIPPIDAILLKWVLHDWQNEECVKILNLFLFEPINLTVVGLLPYYDLNVVVNGYRNQ